MLGLRSAFVAVLLLFVSQCVSAADWPMWMGPNLDGISHEQGWSTNWPEGGLKQVWTKQIGIGFSSVSIVENHLYTMGHEDGRETVWCLDARNGTEIWRQSYDAEKNSNLYEGGPGATPTVHGDHVFTLSIDGRLMCMNRKFGNVVWEKTLQDELDVELHEWGFNSSPFIHDDKVLVQGGRVAAFDVTSGKKIWQTKKHRAGYGAVRAFRNDGRLLLASLDCDGLRITKPSDGSEIGFTAWKSPFGTNSTTPIIVGSKLFISTGYNVGCGLFNLHDGELDEIYAHKKMRNHFNNCILHDGYLYGMDGNSNLGRVVTLTCMDYNTGEVQWKERGMGCGSLMIADNKLIILTEDGNLVAAKASPKEYSELARSKFLTGRCWTVPVLLNGHVYGRNAEGDLVCVELP